MNNTPHKLENDDLLFKKRIRAITQVFLVLILFLIDLNISVLDTVPIVFELTLKIYCDVLVA